MEHFWCQHQGPVEMSLLGEQGSGKAASKRVRTPAGWWQCLLIPLHLPKLQEEIESLSGDINTHDKRARKNTKVKWPCLSGTIKMNRGWLIKRQFKIFTWHSVKATELCNSTDTINAVSLPWAEPGAGLARTLPWRAQRGLCRSSSALLPASRSHRGPRARTPTPEQGKAAFSSLSPLLLPFLSVCVIPKLTVAALWNSALDFWALSGGRQGWGAWSWTGAGCWLSAEQHKAFPA